MDGAMCSDSGRSGIGGNGRKKGTCDTGITVGEEEEEEEEEEEDGGGEGGGGGRGGERRRGGGMVNSRLKQRGHNDVDAAAAAAVAEVDAVGAAADAMAITDTNDAAPAMGATAAATSTRQQQPNILIETPMEYGTKPGHFETSKIHFPTSERTSEWPCTYVSILVCSRPQCDGV